MFNFKYMMASLSEPLDGARATVPKFGTVARARSAS
jgi:hypothetical protein